MLQSALRYCLSHPVRAAYTLASEPFEIWTAFQDRFVASRERPVPPDLYQADRGWECRMHALLGVSQPCRATSEFWALWPEVMGELKAKGIRVGPESFKGWNDGDAGFVRAIWCLARHLRPRKVVETGVAHGVSSRFILEALERNGAGHLWSVDHPPLEHVWHEQIGTAVGDRYSDRWSYVRGSSKRRLPSIFSEVGQIDLFVHDSLHSEDNVRFEMERAWAALRPGGAIVVDDIDANWGFKSFVETFSGHKWLICEAEPLRPDLRRFNKKGLFGIILKEPTASSEN
ncbi:Methyltransferase domain-containing protein [Bradyrhizobium sp. Rc2d]|nr:Methyltransferase domain-containing protein [Bradyrhizobium sp. Rc2d]